MKCAVCKCYKPDSVQKKWLYWGIFGERVCRKCLHWAHEIYENTKHLTD